MTDLLEKALNQPTSKFLSRLTREQLDTIKGFDEYNEYKHFAINTRVNQLRLVGHLGDDVQKDFQDMTKDDIITWLRNKDITSYSKQTYQLYLQKFFKWLGKDVEGWFEKINNAYDKTIAPSSLWSPEEINQLIQRYPETQYRALVATSFDSEARVSEVCSMNVQDVEIIADICVIYLRESKTQKRRVELIFATKELIPWYNIRKAQAEPGDPLWISKCNRNRNQRLSQGGVYEILKYGQQISGIKKKLHPHLLRHSMASYLRKRGYPDALHLKRMGLKPGSNILERYTHVSDFEVSDGARQAFGIEPIKKRKQEPNPLTPLKCPRCGTYNRQSDKVCKKCFYTLDYEIVHEDISLFEICKTNFGKIEKQKIFSMFNSLKTTTPLLKEFLSCFNGSDELEIETIKHHFKNTVNLTDNQIIELFGILMGYHLIDFRFNKIHLLDRSKFEKEIEEHNSLLQVN
jgi:site-specific recombinase XerD